KNLLVPGMLFEDLGFQYFGPFDGHNITELITIFKKVQSHKHPVLIHIITRKGKGYNPAEENPTKYHGVSAAPLKEVKPSAPSRSYTDIFADAMLKEAEQNSNVVAITAAMAEGTGLVPFQERFPERFFDVGIAEGHAVTFAAGLATGGLRPVCAIYSTFLQRAFDHVIHDVAIQKLPVVFAIDRAGLVGEDGPTHHGVFDLTYLSTIPNMVVAAPKDGRELRSLLHTALEWNHGPFAIRFPRAKVPDKIQGHVPRALPVGKWEQLREGSDIAVLAVGSMVNTAMEAAQELEEEGVNITLINCRYVKPIDEEMLQHVRLSHRLLVSIEENSGIGGFASILARALAHQPGGASLFSLHLPDKFIEHGARSKLLEQVGLSTESIKKIIYLLATGGKSLDLEKFAASYDVLTATTDGLVEAMKESA
ncbi:1-deoxy-D-xylulose-5-phosphate synthase, partial [bacterium]|nr:1-deoxy-D-xylulose-5-phosphate synthase [bacterium]